MPHLIKKIVSKNSGRFYFFNERITYGAIANVGYLRELILRSHTIIYLLNGEAGQKLEASLFFHIFVPVEYLLYVY
jgi:hypothetical protein